LPLRGENCEKAKIVKLIKLKGKEPKVELFKEAKE
jgi:hypothetical protein